MSTFWKVTIGLLLALPVGAYITGTLVASQAEMPAERTPVVISDAPSGEAPPSTKPSPDDTDTAKPATRPGKRPTKKQDDDGGRGGVDGAQVVRPTPNQVDDDERGDDDGGDDTDDGGGDDDG